MIPNRKHIAKDIYNLRNIVFGKALKNVSFFIKPTIGDDCYENFLKFIKNSFEFEYHQDKNLCILDYVCEFNNLKFFFDVIHKPNVFVVEQPSFQLYYLSDDNQLTSETKCVIESDIYRFEEKFKKNNKILILYMIREDGSIRYVEVDKDPRYLQLNVKERIKKDRRLKLDKINEQIPTETYNNKQI